MRDVNSITLCGRVTHDVGERDFSYLSTGTPKLKISIAVNDSKKQGDQWVDVASYFDIDYLGKPAEAIKPYIKKGTQIVVLGALKQERWEKDGEKKRRVYINASMIQLAGGRKDSGNNNGATFTPIDNAMPSSSGDDSFMDESIPF